MDRNRNENLPDSSEKVIIKDISRIGEDLVMYGNDLAQRNDEYFEKYYAMQKLHNVRTKDSLTLLDGLCDEDQEKYKTEILKFVQVSSQLIKERNETFYKFQRRWEGMNDIMRENYKIDFLLSGIKKRRLMTNSVYLFLQAENVERLDLLWKEYLDETLNSEIQRTMFRGLKERGGSVNIVMTDGNYNRYRQYLGENW